MEKKTRCGGQHMRTNENNTGNGRGERTNTNWDLLGIVISFFRCILPE